MSRPIHHNPEARDALVNLIMENNKAFGGSRTEIEECINRLVEHAIADAIKYNDSGYTETIGAMVVATIEDEGGHNDIFVTYYYNANTGTDFDFDSYLPYTKEEADPLLITGMIADEGF